MLFDADYWVANLRNPVRFARRSRRGGGRTRTFVEISPHPLLTHAITETLGDTHHHSLGTLQRDTDDTLTFHTNLNTTHTTHPPPTDHPPEPHPHLPTTPWHHTRHWITRKKPTTTPGHDVESFAHVIDWQPRQVGRASEMDAAGAVAVVGDTPVPPPNCASSWSTRATRRPTPPTPGTSSTSRTPSRRTKPKPTSTPPCG